MNFGYSVAGLLKGRKVTISVWDRKTCVRLAADDRDKIRDIVDTFGCNSAQAQGLPRPVTDYNRLKSSDHRLYLICKPHWVRGTRVIGGIRCGRKHLYFKKEDGYEECEPMCLLDFYIHENYQRRGIGRRLFRAFLEGENEQANTIAYDRPSSKLIGFFKKYYGRIQLVFTRFAHQASSSIPCSSPGLSRSVHQNNNFAVFQTFFEKTQLLRVKVLDKRSGCRNRVSTNSSIARSPKKPTRPKNSPPTKSRKSTTSASSSIISRYSGFQKSSRASEASVDSVGNPKEPFSRTTRRLPLRPLPKRLTQCPNRPPVPSRIPTGPYPGWQPLEPGPRIQSRRKKESVGLTRLTPIQSFAQQQQQQPPTPSCRCVPPWATGLAADRTTGIVKKFVTASAITGQKPSTVHDSSKTAYITYKGRSVEALGAKNCLHWGR